MHPRLTVSVALVLTASHAAADPIWHQRSGMDARWDPTVFVRQGQPLRLLARAEARRPCLRWYRVSPETGRYDNHAFCVGRPGPCAQPIAYALRELTFLRGRQTFDVRDVPVLQRPGTHWLTVSSCAERPRPRFATSQRPAAFSLVVRRDDSYVGRLTELLGVPYVFAPVKVRGEHQTDLRLGADCVSLAIYGRRRLGAALPYLSLSLLLKRARLLDRAPALTALLSRRPFARVGDLLHLQHHVAVVSRDNPPAGLGPEDLVIHTLRSSAEEILVEHLPSGLPVHLLRW